MKYTYSLTVVIVNTYSLTIVIMNKIILEFRETLTSGNKGYRI